jgi:hypothetical protein
VDQIPRKILWHYGEKNYAPVLYLTHSGRTKGLILSQLCLATALLLFILREEETFGV